MRTLGDLSAVTTAVSSQNETLNYAVMTMTKLGKPAMALCSTPGSASGRRNVWEAFIQEEIPRFLTRKFSNANHWKTLDKLRLYPMLASSQSM